MCTTVQSNNNKDTFFLISENYEYIKSSFTTLMFLRLRPETLAIAKEAQTGT